MSLGELLVVSGESRADQRTESIAELRLIARNDEAALERAGLVQLSRFGRIEHGFEETFQALRGFGINQVRNAAVDSNTRAFQRRLRPGHYRRVIFLFCGKTPALERCGKDECWGVANPFPSLACVTTPTTRPFLSIDPPELPSFGPPLKMMSYRRARRLFRAARKNWN